MITALIFFVLSLFCGIDAQASSPIPLNTYQCTGDYMTSDKQGNLYVVNRNKVSRYNIAGKNSGDYTWDQNITSVDASDPSRILIFSKSGRMAKYLDGTMNEYTPDINLKDLGIETPTCVCTDKFDGFWVYDSQQDNLFQINRDFLISNNTYALSALTSNSFTPISMKTNDKQIFVSDPFRGIMIFSYSGKYIETIPLFGAIDFDVNSNKDIAFYFNNSIILYNVDKRVKNEIDIKGINCRLTAVSLNSEPPTLFMMDDRAIKSYGF